MKWWTTILSLYLLGLALWPCSDEILLTIGQQIAAVVTPADNPLPGSAHQPHDQCTPFCTCTCCAATITVVPRFNYAIPLPVGATLVAVAAFCYAPAHWADPLSAIWQPPKLRV